MSGRTRARVLATAVVVATAGIASASFDLMVTNPHVGAPGVVPAAGSDAGGEGGFDGITIGSDGSGVDGPVLDGGMGSDAGSDADADAGSDASTGPVLYVDQTLMDFGSLPVAQTSTQMVLLRNDGSVPLTSIVVSLGANAAHWSVSNCTATSPCSLPSFGDDVTVAITFQPTTHGDKGTMAQVASAQTAAQSIDLRGVGLGAVMVITNPPASSGHDLDLGTIPRGQMTSAPITIRNNGNTPMSATVMGYAPPYNVTPDSAAIGDGTMEDFVVTCGAGTASASNDQTFAVMSDAYAGGNQQVTVHCAIANTVVQVDPLKFDFGELRTNGGPQTRSMTVTVTNPATAAAPARVFSMQLRSMIQGLTLAPAMTDTTLAPGQTATAVMQLSNAADTDLAGQFLDIHVDAEHLALPVTGKVVTARSRVVPAELDLGTACVGTQISGNVMLINEGTATLAVESPQMDQSFVASSPGTPTALPPLMSLTAAVSPAMTAASGVIAGTLTWHDDVPSDHTIPVELEHVASGTALSPRGLDFGSVAVDAETAPQRIRLQNCDLATATIEIESLRTKQGTLGAWIVEPRVGFKKTLQGREEQAVSVTFDPPARGRYEADLTVLTDQGKQIIHLVGDATGRDFDTTSFYACACNGPGAPSRGWPIALAVVAVIARRRRGSSSSR